MSTVSVSQPWWAMVSALKPFGIASQPLTAAPPVFQIWRSLFSRMARSGSAVEGRTLRIEGPAGNQELHRAGVVARAQAVTQVELMRLLDLRHVELDAEAGPGRHRHQAAFDLERLARH